MPPKALITMLDADDASMHDCMKECSPSSSKRRISFNEDRNKIRLIPHINELEKSDVAQIWYEKTDYDGMKQSFLPTIRKMMKGDKIEETNEETIRGLEFRTRPGAIRRQHNKLQALHAVLDEQERQKMIHGHLNDDQLADVYRSCASHCSEAAYLLALQDETFAKEHAAEDCSEEEANHCESSFFEEAFKHLQSSSSTKSAGSATARKEKSHTSKIKNFLKQVRKTAAMDDFSLPRKSIVAGAVH
jgi:hypothetical protein